MDTHMRSWLATAGSLFLHGVAAWALLTISNDGGLTQQQSESISTTSVETVIVEAVQEESVESPAASIAQAATEVASVQEKPSDPQPPEEPTEPVAEESKPITDLATSQEPEAPLQKTEPKREPKQEPPKHEPPKRKETKQKKKDGAEKQRAASINARGKTHDGATGGRVTASQGDILSYAAQVRARVAGRKPSGAGHSGTVIVAFGVSPSGSIVRAAIVRSSGSGELDRASVAAVRSAGPFPEAPDRRAHAFSIPFHFQ